MNSLLTEYLLHPTVGLTLKVTLLALVLQFVIGLPVGIFLSGNKKAGKSLVEIIVTLPMIFPPMALGFFLLLLVGKNGVIGKFVYSVFHCKIVFSFFGLLIATFVVGLPFMVKSVQAACEQLSQSLFEAAATLGKNKVQTVLHVVMPNIKGGILTGLLLAFGRSIGEVGISLMLGGNIIGKTETLSLAIYNAVFEGDIRKAVIFSVILSIIAIIVLFLTKSKRS